MKILTAFSTKEVDAFSKGLAQELAKRYPPAMEKDSEKKISQKRLTNLLEETLFKARQFKQQHKLGVYKKAKLVNSFKWELKELGYSEQFIDLVTEGLVVYVTKK